MPVKDLINRFNEVSTSASASRMTPSPTTRQAPSRLGLSSPSPARFLRQSRPSDVFSREGLPAVTSVSHPYFPNRPTSFSDFNSNNEPPESTADVTDLDFKSSDDVPSILSATTTTAKASFQPDDHELYPQDAEESQGLLRKTQHRYPPSATSPIRSSSPTSTLVHRRHPRNHTPVPATIIFARKSIPLHLPKLDAYLSSLDRPRFTMSEGKEKSSVPLMFRPVDRLSASGSTIEELEANSSLPSWRNRGSVFGSLVNVILGLTSSSALATYYSLQGLFNTVQIFALILSTIVERQKQEGKWRDLFLGTIPNILAFNFASTLVESLLFLIVFMGIAAILLFHFYRSTRHSERCNYLEGHQQLEPQGGKWGLVIVSFLLTVIYLPLSTLAVHVLVWSQDLWVVPNPYINATSYPPTLPPLGPPDEFRDPLDFCWTTTMQKNQANFAPVVVIISAVVFLSLTIWFPLRLHKVIKRSVPRVDPYTELGQLRSSSDMDREYQRLLVRDRNPFSFLYRGFRRNWGTYESTYLFAKLSTLFIIAVIDSDNCLFRSFPRSRLAIARQVLLLFSTISFFSLQCYLAPFMNPINNASEWISRLNYVAAATVALAMALNVPGYKILDGLVLYIIYGVTYGLSIYFTIIDVAIMQRVVKKLARRIDFSIDIFSPRLDLSLHTRRRIWQESITTLLLTDPDCAIPKKQRMIYAQSRDCKYPPYLLNFLGSPGERHVENLKILREVGSLAYTKAVALVYGPDGTRFRHLEEAIQKHFVGPDCYWKSPSRPPTPGHTKCFGNAWWIPFPPTLVIQYDDGPIAVLQEISDLESYVDQNSSEVVRRKREIRLSLRALEGQTVCWPYEHVQPVGSYSSWFFGSRRYDANTSVQYQSCVLRIKHRGQLVWRGLQLGSGFDVELAYGKGVRVDGGIIGLTDDYDLTPSLARFLVVNQDRISERLERVESTLASYRQHHRKACQAKNHVLTYRFLSCVYDVPREPTGLTESSIEFERDSRVKNLVIGSKGIIMGAYERFAAVSTSEARKWWYIFWDDLWRRNHETISALQLHASDFNPYYSTSIAYTPLPRPALEAFLIERGLLSRVPRWGDFFHTGFLNKLYLRLNEAVFSGSNQAILFHIGDGGSEMDMESVDLQTQARSSTMGTGGGTDYDVDTIQARPTYRWEGLLNDPLRKGKKVWRRRWFAKMGAWFGITPVWGSEMISTGLAVDVKVEKGRYVLC